MKILVIELKYADPSILFEDDQLVNLRYLMDAGCWGTLAAEQGASSWPNLGHQMAETAQSDYSHVMIGLMDDQPDCYRHLDQEIGAQLESISDDAIVLVARFSADGAPGCFVLAAPNSALSGRLDGVRLRDIAATLLTLGGFPQAPGIQGVSLALPVEPGSKFDDEELIRERLRGLGYIA